MILRFILWSWNTLYIGEEISSLIGFLEWLASSCGAGEVFVCLALGFLDGRFLQQRVLAFFLFPIWFPFIYPLCTSWNLWSFFDQYTAFYQKKNDIKIHLRIYVFCFFKIQTF